MKYEYLREHLQSGDIVLFRGDSLVSRIIRWWCSLTNWMKHTKYSHVGLVWREGNRILLFESTNRKGVNGVQLNLLSDRVKEYKTVVVRKLFLDDTNIFHKGNKRIRPPWFITKMREFITATLSLPYETDLLELAKSANKKNSSEDGGDYFCSELAAEAYQTLALFSGEVLSNNFDPEDFAFGGEADKQIRFSEYPACLDKEYEVTK